MQAAKCKWLASKLREDAHRIVLIRREGKPCGENCRAFHGAGNCVAILAPWFAGSFHALPYLSPSLISFCSEINEQTSKRKTGGF